jgi:hypothetical protein
MLGLWTAFGVLMVAHVQVRFGGRPTILTHVLAILPFYWAWVPMMPLMTELAERYDLRTGGRFRPLAAHLAGAILTIALHSLLYSAYRALVPLDEPGRFATVLRRTVLRHATGDVTTYAVVVAAVLTLRQHRRARAREREAAEMALRASRLEAQLSAARLAALQMQLRPHFLFNALNTISVLVLKGAATEAIRAIRQLADLLRSTLRAADTPERSLDDEVAFAGQYLAIEQLRFGDRLRVAVEIEEDATAALVPQFVLQPLIENAIVHGLGSSGTAGRIRIGAHRAAGMLRLEVWDDGGTWADGGEQSEGVGLANTRARLLELYGDRARLRVAAAPDGGTLAEIALPFRTRGAPTGGAPAA